VKEEIKTGSNHKKRVSCYLDAVRREAGRNGGGEVKVAKKRNGGKPQGRTGILRKACEGEGGNFLGRKLG